MTRHLFVAVLGAALLPGIVAGQTHVEVRGGLAVGSHTGTAAGLDMVPKPSFEGLVVHQMTPRISLYGGFARTAFGCEEGFCTDRDLTITGTQGVLGGQGNLGGAWLRLGALYGTTQVGTEGEASDAGLGVHVGAGYAIELGRLSFSPGVSYRRMSAKTSTSADHAAALTADLGIAIRLGG